MNGTCHAPGQSGGHVVKGVLPDRVDLGVPEVRREVCVDCNRFSALKFWCSANLPGSNTNAVAEYVMSALMHLRRPLLKLDFDLQPDEPRRLRLLQNPVDR
jgi:hypothetical protein